VWSNRNNYSYSGWVYYGSMVLGNYGASNSLTISNGGTVWVGQSGLVVGAQTGAVDNSILVDGGFLWITNSSGAALDVRRGSLRRCEKLAKPAEAFGIGVGNQRLATASFRGIQFFHSFSRLTAAPSP
jgi:hypothetical protein